MSRTITVFSTQGKNKSKYEVGPEVTNWGQLAEIVGQDYKLNTLIATESISKHDLVSTEAALPEGDFKLFLRPKKTKSGLDVDGKSFSELRAIVKENRDDDAFMEHLHSGMGKNYTQFTTDELRSQLSTWNPGSIDSTDDSELTVEQKIEKIKALANEVNAEGTFVVTVDVEEGCDEECQEDKALEKEAENLMKTFS